MLDDPTATMVAEIFDLGDNAHISGEPERGELGRIWPVTTERGRWAVKEPFEPQSEDEERPNAEFAALALAQGVATPESIRTTDGRLLAEVSGQQYRVYSWLDMAATDTGIDPGLVGQLAARLHSIRVVRDEGVDPWYTEPVGIERWRELAVALTTAGSLRGPQFTDHLDELARLEALLEPPRDLQVCHCDLWADNVRLMPTGELCVFDWENAGNADPSQEVTALLFEYTRGDPDRARTLMAAYVDAGGPGRITGRGTFTMPIAQLGHISEWACERWLAADDQVERDRLDHLLGQFLDDPLTVDGIDQLIEAAQYAQRSC